MHIQPQTSGRPALTLAEAKRYEAHHLYRMWSAIFCGDRRMAGFHEVRATYLRNAITTGAAK